MRQKAELPLLNFFQALRKAGFALGVDDYALLWRALDGGFGIESSTALYRLCRTMWFKHGQSQTLFDELFAAAWRELQQAAGKSAAPSAPGKPDAISPEKKPDPNPFSREKSTEKPRNREENPAEPEDTPEQWAYLSLRAGQGNPTVSPPAGPLPEQRSFVFQGAYQPIRPRQAALILRKLRTPVMGGEGDIDLEATVKAIAQTGYFTRAVFAPRITYATEVVLLIDTSPSMVAFRQFGDALAAALPGDKTRVYFFRNVPGPPWYSESAETHATSAEQTLRRRPAVLIFSDGGAARGKYVPERVQSTFDAVQSIRALASHVAWINPVPPDRWAATTAEWIAKLAVPMFEATEKGLNRAVGWVKGSEKRMVPHG